MPPVIGLISPGDMGHAIGSVLTSHGLRVQTHLGGRSPRTRALAAEAGLVDTPSLTALVQSVDVFLSVLVPARALDLAAAVGDAIRGTGAHPLYVDLNAIAPRTVQAVAEVIHATGGRAVDGGIIGPPPRPSDTASRTRIYVSGPEAAALTDLNDYGLDVRVVGDAIGQASGLKMCYAALTKGLVALGTELLLAADRLGLADALRAEQTLSQPELLAWLARSVPTMPPKAYRWVGEMEEIATTFADLGLPPETLLGAAALYAHIAATPLGAETPESRDRDRDLDGVIAALGAADAFSGAATTARPR